MFFIIPMIFVPIVFVITFIAIVSSVTSTKKMREFNENVFKTSNKIINGATTEDGITHCSYCGSIIYRTEKTCSSCGAKKTK